MTTITGTAQVKGNFNQHFSIVDELVNADYLFYLCRTITVVRFNSE